ncbi:MAG: hypothetical protein NWF05_00450 [Candidatus Bathyarchaeota archaeon]|nr:hypothetical protein [Candidatus Bathyarchaeota archaeon]
MTENTQKALLPFASYLPPESGTLSGDVEKAVVFCLTEAGREDGGGFFRKQPKEKIVFVACLYYPFWIANFRDATLLLDGLNVKSHTITYPTIPNPNGFENNLNQRSTNRQAYVSFLSDNRNYFEAANGEKTKEIDGLVFDDEFSKEFLVYLYDTKLVTDPLTDCVVVSPAYNATQIEAMLKGLQDSREQIAQELTHLNEVIKLLNSKTQQFLVLLRADVAATEEKFSGQIQEATEASEKEKEEVNKEYNEKVTGALSNFEQETLAIQKEKITLEKTVTDLTEEIEHIESEIRTSAVNKDYDTEQHWKEKRSELKKQIPDINYKIKDLEVQLQDIEDRKKKALFELKQETDVKLKATEKRLLEVEASRDAELGISKSQMEKIEELTVAISGMIDKLTKMREATLDEFDSLGIKVKRAENTLVYMPFYLICYQSKSNKRYTYLAPSFVTSGGFSARLKAFGKMKITKMLQPRSQKMNSILNGFIGLLDSNVAFSHEISEASSKANLLQSTEALEAIKNGLAELKTKEWLSESEFEFFNHLLPQR